MSTQNGRSPARMPVLFINSAAVPGADTKIHFLALQHLDRTKFEVHVAAQKPLPGAPAPAFDELTRIEEVTVRPTNFGPSIANVSRLKKAGLLVAQGGSTVLDVVGLAGYVRRRGIRVLHSTDRPRDALACALISKLSGAKSVIHVHVGMGEWMKPSVLWALKKSDALIGVSSFVRGTFDRYGVDRAKSHAVLNSMELDGWQTSLDPAPIRAELGIAPGAPVILTASRLFHWKGQAELVRALPAVRREFPEVRLVIAGKDDLGGSPDRPSFTTELQQLSRELGVEGNVLFTGWRPDINRLMAACDVFAMPSWEEPFGLVYLEAMATKRPVVALDSGGAPEVVEHGKSGLLSKRDDVETLAANLIALLKDPALRARMGEYGRAQVEARFTPARMAADLARIYESIA
jgi:glycosyltransferase involved in cell wall biosynthesis